MTPESRICAQRMIKAVRDWDCPPRLPYLFFEIGVGLETLTFDELQSILVTLDQELANGEASGFYSKVLTQRITGPVLFRVVENVSADTLDR
jgi:hypothetical protein